MLGFQNLMHKHLDFIRIEGTMVVFFVMQGFDFYDKFKILFWL